MVLTDSKLRHFGKKNPTSLILKLEVQNAYQICVIELSWFDIHLESISPKIKKLGFFLHFFRFFRILRLGGTLMQSIAWKPNIFLQKCTYLVFFDIPEVGPKRWIWFWVAVYYLFRTVVQKAILLQFFKLKFQNKNMIFH